MKSNILYLFIGVLVALYIYSVHFTFMPITGKQTLAIIGLLVYILTSRRRKRDNSLLSLIIFVGGILLWDIFVSITSGAMQFLYLGQIGITSLSSFFASFCIFYCINRYDLSIRGIMKIIAYVVFIESILTVLIRIFPVVFNLCSSIQVFQFYDGHEDRALDLYRLFGIGNAIYFGVLPSCALGTLSCAFLMGESNGLRKIFYGIMLIIIAVVSFLVTRYSLLVSIVSLFLYFWNNSFFSIRNIIFCISISFFLFLLYRIAIPFLPDSMLLWVFDAFDKDGGSTSALIDWWQNTNIPFRSFVMGDGYYTYTGGYYKNCDIGYFRQIFYGGIIGLGLVVLFYIKIINCTAKHIAYKPFVRFLICLFLCYLISMAKGDLNMLDIFLFFWTYASLFYKSEKCVP